MRFPTIPADNTSAAGRNLKRRKENKHKGDSKASLQYRWPNWMGQGSFLRMSRRNRLCPLSFLLVQSFKHSGRYRSEYSERFFWWSSGTWVPLFARLGRYVSGQGMNTGFIHSLGVVDGTVSSRRYTESPRTTSNINARCHRTCCSLEALSRAMTSQWIARVWCNKRPMGILPFDGVSNLQDGLQIVGAFITGFIGQTFPGWGTGWGCNSCANQLLWGYKSLVSASRYVLHLWLANLQWTV